MNIGLKTFLKYSGRKLPYDAEIEYLESTGTQWIDTGYTSEHRDEIITAVINNHRDISALQPIFGSWGASADYRMQLYKITGRIGGNYVSFQVPGNKVISVVADLLSHRFVIDGRQYSSSGMTSPMINQPLQIFSRNLETNRGVFRLLSFYITRSGNRVMDMIPVRKGDKGYMYDRVSGKLFGNQGTGDFVLGPDIVPVEYLQSTGTQWIDTGIKTSNNIGLSIDCSGIGLDQWMCGGRVGYKSGALGLYRIPSGVLRACYGTLEAETPFDTNRHAIKLEDGILTIDGQQISTFQSQTFSNNSSIYLFNLNINTTGAPSNIGMAGKVYGATLANNHTLVRDFIPVRVGSGSTWEGAMLDRLTHKVYRNAGTGNFLYG